MIGAMADQLDRGVPAALELRDFGSWMASEQKRIFLLCRRMLQDADEANSATQDVFFKAYKALNKKGQAHELDDPGKWITRIAVNTCLDRLRSRSWKMWQRRPPASDEEFILGSAPAREPDAARQLFSKQIQQRLERALSKLSDRQRAVFSLRHYDSMTLEEIGDVLQLDTGTVKAHLFRALSKLRGDLRDLYSVGR
jgi:RNA polymerase sigma-70 factor, ECF subfamily